MFDNWMSEMLAPKIQCSKCNKPIALTGDYTPTEIYCLNCGNKISVGFAEDYTFPNMKYDKNGKLKICPFKTVYNNTCSVLKGVACSQEDYEECDIWVTNTNEDGSVCE